MIKNDLLYYCYKESGSESTRLLIVLICKYLDSGTLSVLLALYSSTLDLKLNHEYAIMQTLPFNLRLFASISGNPVGGGGGGGLHKK